MKNLKFLSHTFLRTTFSLFLILSAWQVAYGMKTSRNTNEISRSEEKKRKVLNTEISADDPFLAKIQNEFFYGKDLDTLEELLSKPEKELSLEEREKLYKQIESFNADQLIPPSQVKFAMQNLLYAFQYIPQLRFPQAFFTPQPYQRLTDLRPSLDKIIEALIKNEQEKIYVCCYHLELRNLAEALVEQKEKGISIEVIVDQSQLKGNRSFYIINVKENGIPVLFPKNDKFEQMHHKFFIFKKNLFNKSLVITGSYNPTKHGNDRSWDDIIILDDPEIVEQYIERFEEIKKRST